jgi:hypothetical protein
MFWYAFNVLVYCVKKNLATLMAPLVQTSLSAHFFLIYDIFSAPKKCGEKENNFETVNYFPQTLLFGPSSRVIFHAIIAPIKISEMYDFELLGNWDQTFLRLSFFTYRLAYKVVARTCETALYEQGTKLPSRVKKYRDTLRLGNNFPTQVTSSYYGAKSII